MPPTPPPHPHTLPIRLRLPLSLLVVLLPPGLRLGESGQNALTQHVHPTSGAGLLSLEPGPQTRHMEDVTAGQLLAARHHLLTTDDAHVVGTVQLLTSSVRVPAQTWRWAV